MVERSNSIELEVRGERASFTAPDGRILPVPSFSAVAGILCSVYWSPVFVWVPDCVRVMERISYAVSGTKRTDLSVSRRSYLCDVRYQIRAHFVWNESRPDLAHDRNEDKHFRIALRSLARGGRRSVYLGRADCPGYVRGAHFGSGEGFYDQQNNDLGEMFHSIDYSSGETRFFRCVMNNGVIAFPEPQDFRKELLPERGETSAVIR